MYLVTAKEAIQRKKTVERATFSHAVVRSIRQIIRGDCSDSPLNEKKPSFEMLLKAENDHCAMHILYFFLRFFGYR